MNAVDTANDVGKSDPCSLHAKSWLAWQPQRGTSHVKLAVFTMAHYGTHTHLYDKLRKVFHDGCNDLSSDVGPMPPCDRRRKSAQGSHEDVAPQQLEDAHATAACEEHEGKLWHSAWEHTVKFLLA